MKKLLVAAAIVAGSCTLALAQTGQGAQGGGQGPSASPSMTQNPKAGATRDDKMPSKKVMMKKKTKKAKNPM